MYPIIKTLKTAHVHSWKSYGSQSDETSICLQKGCDPKTLRAQFAKGFGHLKHKGADYCVDMLQHCGVKYGEQQEDKGRFLTIPFSDVFTFVELVTLITQTITDLAHSVHTRQQNGTIHPSGCTFSGVLVLSHQGKNYAITIQLGDSIIFAITKKFKCIPLVNAHQLFNPAENERVLKAILKNISTHSQLLDDIKLLAIEIENQKKIIGLKTKEEQQIINYLSSKINGLKIGTSDYSSEIEALPKLLSNMEKYSFSYILFLNKTIDNFLTQRKITGLPAVDCIHALFSCINDALIYVEGKGTRSTIHDTSPTRGFGDLKIQPLGAHSFIPEINIYELPSENILLVSVTDGISDVRTPFHIADCARKNNPQFNNAKIFLETLLYDSYTWDEKGCDNLTAIALHLSGKSLNNVALFLNVADGHGAKSSHDKPEHVVNVVNNEFGPLLKRNIIAAIATHKNTNNNASSSVQQLTFTPLPLQTPSAPPAQPNTVILNTQYN